MKINRSYRLLFSFSLVFLFSLFIFSSQVNAASLSGRILLQVESNGEAWYVNPQDGARYYLGRPQDAYYLMRTLGLGVSNKDIRNFLISGAPSRLSGRILLQVEDKGQAYYVNPINLKLYYLARPSDAFNLMRNLGLGISNYNLAKINVKELKLEPLNSYQQENNSNLVQKDFSFKYKNKNQVLSLNLDPRLYRDYNSSPKSFSYPVNAPPPDIQAAFYKIFLENKVNDNSITELIAQLNKISVYNQWQGDQLVELALSFVQYIPYDSLKASGPNLEPYYPYETLYLNKGVCSDKTFLAYNIIKELGYGVAIIDMPDINHSALGIACPQEYSLQDSGYCYGETTNYFPIGVIPQNIESGQAEKVSNDFSNLFSSTSLGKVEIRNKVAGKAYLGAARVRAEAETLNTLYQELMSSKPEEMTTNYQIRAYNEKVGAFNQLLSSFYQK